MPTRDSIPKSLPCWLDLGSSDTDKSAAFYGGLFGWTAESAGEDFGGYITFSLDGVQVAGCMKNDGSMGPDGWSTYLATDDIAKLAESATANGGQVVAEPMAVGDLGQMAFVTDPTGGFIGAWQPGEHKGFLVHNEPNAPGWFELHTRDFDGALAFYREVFGCDIDVVNDTPEFRYAVVMANGLQWAGIMDATAFLPDGVPAHWSVYIEVADADATVAKAQELGGSVVQPAEDTPYGRLATLTDTTGASFKLVQPPAG
jgi:predicted enzyme related to lactoylglutathione lyase